MAVVLFGLLVIIFAGLLLAASRQARKTPEPLTAAQTELVTKWKALVPAYEARGYCMKEYRKRLGMPAVERPNLQGC